MYVEPEFRDRKVTDLAPLELSLDIAAESVLVNNTPLNTTIPFLTSGTFYDEGEDEWYDAYDLIDITKRGEGEHCEIWIADNCSFYDPLDPRNAQITILDWQIEYMIDEFDNHMYPLMTETFMDAPALNGSTPDIWYWQYIFGDENLTQEDIADMLFPTNDTGKLMIVVFNMIDENWYDGEEYRSYTAGYYWPLIRAMYDRNVMHIDCWNWTERIGGNVSRPYVYESTIAHEYQHLLHDEMDPNEESWINEGLSMMAEIVCGYGVPYSHIAWFVAYPENSLTVWGDMAGIHPDLVLCDYGAVALFNLYLYDHYGGTEMLQAIFNSELQGVDSLNDALLSMGHNRLSFDKVFRDWRLANLFTFTDMDNDNPLYGYDPDLITLSDLYEYDIEYLNVIGVEAGDNFDRYEEGYLNPYLFDMPEFYTYYPHYMQAYGTDYYYVEFDGFALAPSEPMNDIAIQKFVFDGDDSIRTGWQYIENMPVTPLVPAEMWYSGSGIDEADLMLTQEVDLTSGNGEHTLTLNTYWDIEEQWDFGFVQVSTDGGETWTSLDDVGDYCRDDIVPDGYPEIIENMPGLTGTSGVTVDLTFDLSAYDGQEILVGYRYMTDWGATEEGWYIYGVTVDGVDMPLADLINPPTPEADFMVTVVINTENGWMIVDIPSLDDTEVAQKLLAPYAESLAHGGFYLLVSSNNGPVNYEFDVVDRGENEMPR